MRIWIVATGEPLPTDPGRQRLLRAGLLTEMMAAQGHQVTWWTSAFDHVQKRTREPIDANRRTGKGNFYTIRLLQSRGYSRNVSIARLIDHWEMRRCFRRESASINEKPDIILCSFPPIELAAEVVQFGIQHRIPTVIDVRDLWPDIFIHLFPSSLQPLSRLALFPYFRMTRQLFKGATAVFGVNDEFTNWGVRYAQRDRAPFDGSFPMAPPSETPSQAEQDKAAAFWRHHGISGDPAEFNVIFAGTIGRQFEFEPVIEAAKALSHKRIRFVICGTGDRHQYVSNLAQNVPNIFMPGWVGASEIWTLMRMTQVGLAPYHDELSFTYSLPNKSIEYLSAGLPVVASLPGALARLLKEEDCGITYQNRDSEGLASAIAAIAADPARQRTMSRNASSAFERKFRAEVVYNDMIACLERIALARRRSD